ncbi:hypothetical protein AB0M13_03530 [Nocardia fluminea]|uniref:hypothetical protein n=1 Tax=Nocardia fluminea TaxID=134984 RepID=UPI0034405781
MPTEACRESAGFETFAGNQRGADPRATGDFRAEYAMLADAAIELRTLRSLRDSEVTIV